MKIIELEGDNILLYCFVARLVMNEEVLKYNLNYPYKTSPQYRWFIAVNDENTIGFVPVKLKNGRAIVNNYYIANDDSLVFTSLLNRLVNVLKPDFEIESVTQIRHVSCFEQSGFVPVRQWKRYVKMKVFGNAEKCL